MIRDAIDYIEQARIAVGSLSGVKSAAIFLSQRRTSGYRGSSSGSAIDATSDRNYGLRVWIQKEDNHCYFSLFALGNPKQLRSEIQGVHNADQWKHVSDRWPFEPINEECFRSEVSYRDRHIDILEPAEVEGRFKKLCQRLSDAISPPIKKHAIDEYLVKYSMIENEEYLWTTGSRRTISHSSSRFVIDLQVKIHGLWVCEGFEEAQFLNLDWRKVSNWAQRWISSLSSGVETQKLDLSHAYFSNYATKQITFAIHKWLLNHLKYGNEAKIVDATRDHHLGKLVSMYDNPREPKVCGRRVWEGRGQFAVGTKFWEEGQWLCTNPSQIPTRSRGTHNLPEPTLCNLVFAPGKSDYVDIFAKSPEGRWFPSLLNLEISPEGILSAEGFSANYNSRKEVFPHGNVKLMAPLFSVLANIEDVGRHLQWYHSIGSSDWLVKSKAFEFGA